MTKLITIQHEATLRPLNLDVAYFDDAEKRKLSAYPTADRIAELVSKGLQVNAAQFLTYYLFHRKRVGKPGYGNYAELETKIEKALTELDGWVDFANGSLTSVPDAMPQDRTITERIGEAGSLCVVSQIHDLHDADWLKIREHSGPRGFPTLDYQFGAATASDGTRIIQVESKGTSVENAAVQTRNVKAQKVRIDKKKNRIRAMEEEGTYQYPG